MVIKNLWNKLVPNYELLNKNQEIF